MTRPTLPQAIRMVQDNHILKSLTDDAIRYIAAWLICKQGDRDEEILLWALRHLERWVNPKHQYITLRDIIESEMFELGEFYEDEERGPYLRRFHETLIRLGIDPNNLPNVNCTSHTSTPKGSNEHLELN